MTKPSRPARQLRLDLTKPRSHARDDFVVSPSNAAAVAALDAWPRWPGGRLALIGPAGCGKTHLARAWADRVGAVTVASGSSAIPSVGAGPILLEDVDRHLDDEALFHLLNRTDAGATLLVTGRTGPATWPSRLADLRSRLNALPATYIETPDEEVLLQVMKKLFSERNIAPRSDVSAFILRRIERSVPAVQDMVRRIDELSSIERREITRALVSRLVQDKPGTP
jgi:chromosomal replication initiation ATPase DnaA